MLRKISIIIALLLLPALLATAQNTGGAHSESAQDDSTTVSLLTCSPGEEIHRLYGHTALRLQSNDEDWAVNFGWFSFNTPNFVMKFILGLTDYSMAYQTMPIFLMDLMRDNMAVTEQTLNLTPEEAAYVKRAMRQTLEVEGYDTKHYNFARPGSDGAQEETILAAHWTYRYNFLYDNCTTRAIEAIKEALKANGEELVYPTLAADQTTMTQREMIHEFTRQSPWYEFGQDLLLGPEVDEEHTLKELTDGLNFLPTYAQNFFDKAEIRGKDGKMRPLVGETMNLTPFLVQQERKPAVPFTPMVAAAILAAVGLIIAIFERKAARQATPTAAQRAWRIWGNAFDFTCWTVQGLVGILLVIMVGWSQHPAVGTNWLLLVFNPLYLLGIPVRLWWKKWKVPFAAAVVVAFVTLVFIDIFDVQDIPSAAMLYAFAVAYRCTKPVDAFLMKKK